MPVSVLKGIIAGPPPNNAKHTVNYASAASDLQLC